MEGEMLKSLAVFVTLVVGPVFAAGAAPPSTEFGSIGEAKEMLQRAVAELRVNERLAIDNFNFNRPGFRDRDLFVFCFDRGNGKFTAHEAFVGWDVRKIRDAAGHAVGGVMFAIAKEGQLTEIPFLSAVLGRTHNAPRLAYVTAVGNHVCGVSAFLFNGELGSMQ
jgi:hypothetical protein